MSESIFPHSKKPYSSAGSAIFDADGEELPTEELLRVAAGADELVAAAEEEVSYWEEGDGDRLRKALAAMRPAVSSGKEGKP